MTRRLFRSFLSLSVEGRRYYEFTETTGYASASFESLRVPAFPPNAILSATILVVLRGVLETAADAGRVVAREVRRWNIIRLPRT